jgi:hypothetical protein
VRHSDQAIARVAHQVARRCANRLTLPGWARAHALPLKTPQTGIHSDSVRPGAASRWLQFLIPSVSDLLFVALLAGLSCGALGRLLLRDSDTGWHIRNGQLMLHTYSITRVDSFSATMSGQPWYAWEWLYDVLVAATHHVFGLNGVVFYTAAIIAATLVLVFHLAMRRGGSLPVTLLLIVLSIGSAAIHFLARPHVVSWLFTVIWFEILDSSAGGASDEKNARLYWLPVLMLVWVNLHGGFILGFILLGVYLVGGTVQYYTAREKRKAIGSWLRRLGLVSGLSILASFVNPYGYKLHLHIYQYLSDRFLMDRVSEFLSPDFHGAAQQCFAALLLITIVALASARRRPEPAQLLVVLLAAYSGLYSSRNLPVSSMLLMLIVAPVLSETIAKVGEDAEIASWLRALFSRWHAFGSRMGKMESQLHGHSWLVLAFVLGLWACAHGGRLGSAQVIDAYFDEKRYPVEAVQVIADRDIREPIFCPDLWGGYLIYRLYPQTKVLVDDRHDLYGNQFFKDYLKVVYVQADWEKVLDEKHVNWILVQKNSSLGTILGQTPSWKLIHEDATAVLFHRSP